VGTLGLVLLDIALVAAVARLLGSLLSRARQPPVMGEVLAGLVLGASVLGALPGDPSGALFTPGAKAVLSLLGEAALVAYLFGVGAELDLRALRREGRVVASVAVVSFVVPWLAGAALALAIHEGVATDSPLVPFTLFLGTALAVTAFPVLARIVDGRGLRERLAGRVALAAAAAQEVLVWPALAIAVALHGAEGGAPAKLLLPGALLLGIALPRPARAAGLALLRTGPATLASALLLPLFFALPALRVDLGALGGDGLGLLALVLAVAVAAKLASAAGAAALAGLPRREALTVGALMNARGLVELVVLTVGLEAGLIDERLFAVMVVMALVTTFATGPLVDWIGRARTGRPPRRRALHTLPGCR
jgi:Kef-type K+ transport system membrane component KefB